METTCWHCGTKLDPGTDYSRAASCTGCRRDTRVCRNCLHYDTAYDNLCREPQADRVVEKEKSNFCDYFKATNPKDGGKGAKAADLKAAAEALFKKK